MYTKPPRALKEPVGVWFSCLTMTSTPVRLLNKGQEYAGVGGIIDETKAAA